MGKRADLVRRQRIVAQVTQGLSATLYAENPDRSARSLGACPERLSAEEREDILVGLSQGECVATNARTMGRHPPTITREVAASGGRQQVGAGRGHCRDEAASKRRKLCHGPSTAHVTRGSRCAGLPNKLRIEFPNHPMMLVSHETIHQSLYVQSRGELRRDLARCLPFALTERRVGGPSRVQGKHANMVTISGRPTEIGDRAVPGHWEGELILGAPHRLAVRLGSGRVNTTTPFRTG